MSCPCLVLSMFSRPCCVFCVFCVICCVYQPLFVILVLIVFHMVILYFTQVNKVLARSLGMCLGEDVMVPMGYMPTAPTLPTWSLWRLHTLFQFSKPITAQSPSPCKWQPPQPLFSSALVMGWCQSHWCLLWVHEHGLGSRHLKQTLARLSLRKNYLLTCLSACRPTLDDPFSWP